MAPILYPGERSVTASEYIILFNDVSDTGASAPHERPPPPSFTTTDGERVHALYGFLGGRDMGRGGH